MSQQYLGSFEEIVLLTVGILHDKAYGVAIKEEIEKRLSRTVRLGALHATLVRLENKGYLSSAYGEPTKKRGGKRKRYFTVTTYGQKALKSTMQTRQQLWESIPGFAFE